MVTNAWKPVPFQVVTSPEAVTVKTRALQVSVARDSGAVTFLDPAGKVLLAERPGQRQFSPHGNFFVAKDSFASPPDEFLYGLGQYQDGMWNWRGLPRELRQQNTIAAVPMLVSSRGYGLLWDNASLTEFNPPKHEVPLVSANDAVVSSKKDDPKIYTWHGEFTSDQAGEYFFSPGRTTTARNFPFPLRAGPSSASRIVGRHLPCAGWWICRPIKPTPSRFTAART